jgi:hypothetical protein
MPAIHPRRCQSGRPTYYSANPMISIRSNWL